MSVPLRCRQASPSRIARWCVVAFAGIVCGVRVADAAEPDRGAGDWRETIAVQVALDNALFSPGIIDGRAGDKTTRAIRQFQLARGLPVTGRADDATRAALGVDPAAALTTYTISPADPARVGPDPKTWPEKSRARQLGYKSLATLVAERGHCTRALLARLNPGKSLDGLAVGDVLTLPNVATEPPLARAARLVVNLAVKQVQPVARDGRALGLFHCSIAKHKEKRPSGRCTVKVVSPDPVYVFDPKMWPEVKGVDRKLVIPPGPRNPVGQFWIGLSLPGYGIHGTPEPELIGKTGSHGCFRLANWDAVRLGRMVRPGIPVEFVNSAAAPDETALRGGPALAAAPAARRGPDATVSRPVRLMALRRASRDPSR